MESVHFYAWVAIPPGSEIDDAVAAAMEPYRVNEDQQESDAEDDADVWDFWTIGGRYTGALDGFDPLQDPENQETCPRCSGSGSGPLPVRSAPGAARAGGWRHRLSGGGGIRETCSRCISSRTGICLPHW